MTRVISNTFSITAQKDNEAARDNLIHCSLMNKNRMTWWTMPSPSEVSSPTIPFSAAARWKANI